MSADIHARAQELIVCGTSSAEEQRWLNEHLASCGQCGGLLQRAQAVRTALRTVPVMADPNLVDATKRRVLRFAAEQQERESHRWLIRLSIGVAAVLTWVSIPLLWRAAQWVGGQTAEPQLVSLLVFLGFGLLPALLAGAAALAARQGAAQGQVPTSHVKGES